MPLLLSLSHLLQRRLLGLSSIEPAKASAQPLIPNYERAFKVVEIELAFLCDILYTSIWAFASLIGVYFVGAVAVIPVARTTHHASPGNIIVHTTIVDFIITGVLQLLRCWTSNWAELPLPVIALGRL